MITFPQLPSYAFMWLIVLALYALAKTATLAAANIPAVPFTRRLAYLLLFPGMNALSFCTRQITRPQLRFLPRFIVNALLGALFLWGLARAIPPTHPLHQGWVGMIGLILLLHFGVLQLVSLAWQAAGFDAPLLMNQPLRSATITDFWNRRWNTAFRQLSHQFVFKPLARRTGSRVALLLTFAASGVVHDLVISVPAHGGCGLPTLYFLLQAAGLLFERSGVGKSMLRQRLAARLFAFVVIALPAPLLFHPPFVMRVMLPFMVAIGALPRS